MYCYARCYLTDETTCKQEYYHLKWLFRSQETNASIGCLIYKDNHYVALYSQEYLSEDTITFVRIHTPSAIDKPLPDFTVVNLLESRSLHMFNPSLATTDTGYTYSENSTPKGYNDAEGEPETYNLSTPHYHASLMYRYWLCLHSEILTGGLKASNVRGYFDRSDMQSIIKSAELMKHQLYTSDKYFFTSSALDMLSSVYETYNIGPLSPSPYDLPFDHDLWIEYSSPPLSHIPSLSHNTSHNISSCYWYGYYNEKAIETCPSLSRFEREGFKVSLSDGHAFHNLEYLSPEGTRQRNYLYDERVNSWFIPSYHTCPTGECDQSKMNGVGITSPCYHCFEEQLILISLFISSLKMIRKEYAVSSSPPSFPTYDRGYSEEKIEYIPSHNKAKRKRGEKDKHIRQVYTPLVFNMISYEVSERSSLPSPEDTSEIQRATRENWLLTTPKGDIIYKKHLFEGLIREYHLPRYRDLIRRVSSGEISNERDLEYTLLYDTSGSPYVRGSIHPYEKYVLLKRRDPSTTVKRVTARRYKKS